MSLSQLGDNPALLGRAPSWTVQGLRKGRQPERYRRACAPHSDGAAAFLPTPHSPRVLLLCGWKRTRSVELCIPQHPSTPASLGKCLSICVGHGDNEKSERWCF